MLLVFLLPPREGLFVNKFYALYPVALDDFWLLRKAISQGCPRSQPAGKKINDKYTILEPTIL